MRLVVYIDSTIIVYFYIQYYTNIRVYKHKCIIYALYNIKNICIQINFYMYMSPN